MAKEIKIVFYPKTVLLMKFNPGNFLNCASIKCFNNCMETTFVWHSRILPLRRTSSTCIHMLYCTETRLSTCKLMFKAPTLAILMLQSCEGWNNPFSSPTIFPGLLFWNLWFDLLNCCGVWLVIISSNLLHCFFFLVEFL